MAAANIVLCVLFGLKNTPLAFIALRSYDQLNILHRVVGYTTVIEVLLHPVCYAVRYARQGSWKTLIEAGGNREGLVAGAAMLVLLMGFFRGTHYETFYITHVIGFIITIIFAGLHRPAWTDKLPYIMVLAAGLWGIDRIIRASRLLCNLVNNEVTFSQLPGGGIRLRLRKPLFGATAGSHVFLWVPKLRLFQTHPFTIVSSSSSGLEMVIKSHNGFTKLCHDFPLNEVQNPLWASVEGPYGSPPDVTLYDKVVLVAGGSGATFTFGLASTFLGQLEDDSKKSMSSLWSVRQEEHLNWFTDHLHQLQKYPSRVALTLHVTGTPYASRIMNNSSNEETSSEEVNTINVSNVQHSKPSNQISKGRGQGDPEKAVMSSNGVLDASVSTNINHGRLDIDKGIRQALESVNNDQRVLVSACGPRGMTDEVREVVRNHLSSDGPSIDFYCESFDW
ncbi:hypothetical protein ACHAPJ_008022 [Fusarium lateritium]